MSAALQDGANAGDGAASRPPRSLAWVVFGDIGTSPLYTLNVAAPASSSTARPRRRRFSASSR